MKGVEIVNASSRDVCHMGNPAEAVNKAESKLLNVLDEQACVCVEFIE